MQVFETESIEMFSHNIFQFFSSYLRLALAYYAYQFSFVGIDLLPKNTQFQSEKTTECFQSCQLDAHVCC